MAAAFPYKADVGVFSYRNIEAFANKSGIPHSIGSDYRPNSITITGNVSYHARGNAVDFFSSKANMAAFAAWWYNNYYPYILELIHSGGGGFFVHNGVRPSKYMPAIVAEHWDHVHVAITNSGLIAAGAQVTVPAGSAPNLATQSTTPARWGCLPQATMIATGVGSAAWMLAHQISQHL